ncbi:Na/Pi cotransporter family protein [Tumebacillus permanentifrigoris]|uniref:Phosphate:Na+ symporter n=1 Tax=Tumebacillus permanentifrigoris TaxID=378543 RepID=A0A316D5C0_9BACL|nr:Na/Pi symporter [Tumebacillus permanentifrigoris]PWK08399.1 phosphate:Na+ symporter [Tumebacillus permanentifrigoris]
MLWKSLLLLCLGLGGFLAGMWIMRTGMERMAVDRLPDIIKRFVKTSTRGLLTGTVLTALIHSSAGVSIIAIGLVSAGAMTFADSLGVILGTNIGTTVTTQVLSFGLESLIIPCLVVGVLLSVFLRGTYKYIGLAVLGFAAIFLALELIERALTPLSTMPWFRDVLAFSSQNPLLGVLAGAVLTALITSSTATTMLTIVLASQGLVDLPGAIAIILGNNIGTCITSIIAAVGTPLNAKRVALAHVILNVLGVAAFLPFVHGLAAMCTWVSQDIAVQVATSHLLFNVISSLAVWPFTKWFAQLVCWLMPDKKAA